MHGGFARMVLSGAALLAATWPAQASGPQAQVTAAARGGDGAAGVSLAADYVGALRLMVTADARAAVERMVAVEEARWDPERPDRVRKLERTKAGIVRRLADDDRESLVPVMVLFHDLALEYRVRGDFVLGGSASRLAVGVAKLYMDETGASETARGTACQLLSSLASRHMRDRALTSAQELLDAALQLEPTCEPALLGLGALTELLGRYELAVAYFGRLHSSHPDNAEAALRLGVNLRRLGRGERAAEALRVSLEAAPPEWVEVVATEELARVLAAGRNPGQAVDLLRSFVDRRPRQRGPAIQLARLLEGLGRRREAASVLDRLDLVLPDGGMSPRFRYSLWPLRDVESLRADLGRAADRRLAALARSLDHIQAEMGLV